jgi:hypothetical protein
MTSNITRALSSSSRHRVMAVAALLSGLDEAAEVYPFHESGLRFSICQRW